MVPNKAPSDVSDAVKHREDQVWLRLRQNKEQMDSPYSAPITGANPYGQRHVGVNFQFRASSVVGNYWLGWQTSEEHVCRRHTYIP